MSERYSKLFSLPENLYTTGAPVVIAAGALLKDNQSGNVLAQLKLQNINSQTIKAATVQIFPMDTAGDAIDESITYQYLDLNAGRDTFFGQKAAIPLPNAVTRSFSVVVTEVIFLDNTKWIADGKEWRPLKKPASIGWGDPELVKQFHCDYGEHSNNMLLEDDDLWICVCGSINRSGETCCHRCRQTLDSLRAFNIENLRKRKDERLALEAAAAEKRRSEEKQRNLRIAKTAPIVLVAIAVLCVAIYFASSAVKKNNVYNSAVSLMEQEEYGQASALFQELGDYKDSGAQLEKITAKYDEACGKMENGEYDGAIDILEKMGDFLDSQSLIDAAKQAKEFTESSLYADIKSFETENQPFFEIHYDAKNYQLIVDIFGDSNGNSGHIILDEATTAQIQEVADTWVEFFDDWIQDYAYWSVKTTVNMCSGTKADREILVSSPKAD